MSASATLWQPGDVITYNQANWGEDDPAFGAGSALLGVRLFNVYTSGFDILGSHFHFTLTFTDPNSIVQYLPAVGTPAALTGSALDPVSTSAGAFGGEVLALELNVDFSDAGLLSEPQGSRSATSFSRILRLRQTSVSVPQLTRISMA